MESFEATKFWSQKLRSYKDTDFNVTKLESSEIIFPDFAISLLDHYFIILAFQYIVINHFVILLFFYYVILLISKYTHARARFEVLRGTTSLKFWKFRFFFAFFDNFTFKNNILKFQVEISNSFWVTAFWRAAAH